MNNPKATMLHNAKRRARAKGIPFSLTAEDFDIPETCPVFGAPLRVGRKTPHDLSPSLDRINPKHGYVPGNVVVVSSLANRLKGQSSPETLRQLTDFYARFTPNGQAAPTAH